MPSDDAYAGLRGRFARSFMDVLILWMVRREPLWGYKMMSDLRRDFGIRVGPSTIYPLLDSMESDGLVVSEEVYDGRRRRKVYRATRRGLELTECFEVVLSEILESSRSRSPPAA